jgi:homoserine kinase type II
MKQFNPDTAEELRPVFSFLESRFMKNHDQLETAFCHGDFHPVNVIWGDADIEAVIDWEFCGVKPAIYDAANLLGCLGIEAPESLTGPFALAFIRRLKDSGLFSEFSWQSLLPFIVAIRFAWLAEWLRKKDTEMIEMELVYMKILVNNETQLRDIWRI